MRVSAMAAFHPESRLRIRVHAVSRARRFSGSLAAELLNFHDLPFIKDCIIIVSLEMRRAGDNFRRMGLQPEEKVIILSVRVCNEIN